MFTSIVVGTDGSSTSRGAVQRAADLARLTGGVLHLVRAFKLPSHGLAAMPMGDAVVVASPVTDAEVIAEIEAELSALAGELGREGIVVKTYACAGSSGANAILDVAEHQAADLVIVGNRGMTGLRRKLGSVPKTVVLEAPCAVMVVHTT
jgi:nucleotide-binding universal stress UspA family protein